MDDFSIAWAGIGFLLYLWVITRGTDEDENRIARRAFYRRWFLYAVLPLALGPFLMFMIMPYLGLFLFIGLWVGMPFLVAVLGVMGCMKYPAAPKKVETIVLTCLTAVGAIGHLVYLIAG